MNLKKVPLPSVDPLPTCGTCEYFRSVLAEGIAGNVSGLDIKCTHHPVGPIIGKVWKEKTGCALHSEFTKEGIAVLSYVNDPTVAGLDNLKADITDYVVQTLRSITDSLDPNCYSQTPTPEFSIPNLFITGLENLQSAITSFVEDAVEIQAARMSVYVGSSIESLRKEQKCSRSWPSTKRWRRRRLTQLRHEVKPNSSSENTS